MSYYKLCTKNMYKYKADIFIPKLYEKYLCRETFTKNYGNFYSCHHHHLVGDLSLSGLRNTFWVVNK